MELTVEARRVEAAKKVTFAIIRGEKVPSVFSKRDIARVHVAYSEKGAEAAVKVVQKIQQKRTRAVSLANREMVFAKRVLAT